MESILVRNWWALGLRGVAAILFGILAFVWPGLTLAVLVLLFGAYALVDGIFALISAIRANQQAMSWWALLLEGVLGIATGIVTFFWPGITALSLLLIVAAWAIVTGVLEVIAAIRLRREISGEWLLGLSGVASLVLGILLVARPLAGLIALTWLVGVYALVFGVILLALAFRLRHWQQETGWHGHSDVPHPA